MRWVVLSLALVGCVRIDAPPSPPELVGAQSAVVFVDRGAVRGTERYEAHAYAVGPSGGLEGPIYISSSTTTWIIGYPCSLGEYGWQQGPLAFSESPGREPPNSLGAWRAEADRYRDAAPPVALDRLTWKRPVAVVSAGSVRSFVSHEGTNFAGNAIQAAATGVRSALVTIDDQGGYFIEIDGNPYFKYFEPRGLLASPAGPLVLDVELNPPGTRTDLLRFHAPEIFDYKGSYFGVTSGLTGYEGPQGPRLYSLETDEGRLIEYYQGDARIVAEDLGDLEGSVPTWIGGRRVLITRPNRAPIEFDDGVIIESELPGALIVATATNGYAFGSDRAVGWDQSRRFDWDCELPSKPVAAAIDDDVVAIAGTEELLLRDHGVCGRCRRIEATPPVAEVRAVALLPSYILVVQNAFASYSGITAWIDREK